MYIYFGIVLFALFSLANTAAVIPSPDIDVENIEEIRNLISRLHRNSRNKNDDDQSGIAYDYMNSRNEKDNHEHNPKHVHSIQHTHKHGNRKQKPSELRYKVYYLKNTKIITISGPNDHDDDDDALKILRRADRKFSDTREPEKHDNGGGKVIKPGGELSFEKLLNDVAKKKDDQPDKRIGSAPKYNVDDKPWHSNKNDDIFKENSPKRSWDYDRSSKSKKSRADEDWAEPKKKKYKDKLVPFDEWAEVGIAQHTKGIADFGDEPKQEIWKKKTKDIWTTTPEENFQKKWDEPVKPRDPRIWDKPKRIQQDRYVDRPRNQDKSDYGHPGRTPIPYHGNRNIYEESREY